MKASFPPLNMSTVMGTVNFFLCRYLYSSSLSFLTLFVYHCGFALFTLHSSFFTALSRSSLFTALKGVFTLHYLFRSSFFVLHCIYIFTLHSSFFTALSPLSFLVIHFIIILMVWTGSVHQGEDFVCYFTSGKH